MDDVLDIEIGSGCVHPDPSDLTKVTCEIDNAPVGTSASLWGYLGFNDGQNTVVFTNKTDHNITNVDFQGEGRNTYTTGDPNRPDANIVGGGHQGNTFTVGNNAVVSSSVGDDVINVVGDDAWIRTGGGKDTVTISGLRAEVLAGDGNDEIQGGPGNDILHGEAGNDVIYGNDGDDNITGGTGNDELYGGRHNDTLYGNSGDDVIFGNSGDDYISGGPGEDTLSGGTGTNTVIN
ncbi:hypothetical protein LWF15_30015 [Kineosporia rhizophila]|uniref:calcium-binding protein n=1 Tax=Kineosporia TaxID=49184 RepID=UPI001E373F1F|nr:calcium-binding protein [Kineosporia sp. NBRC 101677]MCE0539744.1 hypothetical protein [Kineosporia rhizophila]GLY16360.1 hypothetical protein Kisp01_33750 [Kineosporia sp. NBRC 101677]